MSDLRQADVRSPLVEAVLSSRLKLIFISPQKVRRNFRTSRQRSSTANATEVIAGQQSRGLQVLVNDLQSLMILLSVSRTLGYTMAGWFAMGADRHSPAPRLARLPVAEGGRFDSDVCSERDGVIGAHCDGERVQCRCAQPASYGSVWSTSGGDGPRVGLVGSCARRTNGCAQVLFEPIRGHIYGQSDWDRGRVGQRHARWRTDYVHQLLGRAIRRGFRL